MDIYDQAMNSYQTSRKSEIVYDDTFAGVFIDDTGFLNIGVTEPTRGLSNFSGRVKYREFAHSYNSF